MTERYDNRIEWIDLAKGLAIWLMILGHCIQYYGYRNNGFWSDYVFRAIYGFHMPFFAFLSGVLFYRFFVRYGLYDGVIRKVNTILIPCMTWGTIGYIVECRADESFFSLKHLVHYTLGHNWFLWCVFYCSIVVLFISKIDKSVYKLSLLVIVICFIVPDIQNSRFFEMMYIFFLLGFLSLKLNLYSRIEKIDKKRVGVLSGVLLISYLCITVFIASEDILSIFRCYCLYDISVLYKVIQKWCINIVGCISIMGLIISCSNNSGAVSSLLKKMGKNTLGIYMIQQYFFLNFERFVVCDKWGVLLKMSYVFASSIVILLISYIGTELIGRGGIVSRIMLGK